MTQNMGTADRVIRTLAGVGIAALYFTGAISGTVAIVLGVIAAALLFSSALGWCPAYAPFGFSTRRRA